MMNSTEAITQFMKGHRALRFSAMTIYLRTGIDIGTVRRVLNRLEADDKVTKNPELNTQTGRTRYLWQWTAS